MLKFSGNKCYLDVKDNAPIQEQLEYLDGMELINTGVYLDRTLQTLTEALKKAQIIVPFDIEVLARVMDLFFWNGTIEELHDLLNDFIDKHLIIEAVALEISLAYEKALELKQEPDWCNLAMKLGVGQLILNHRKHEWIEEMIRA